MNRIKTTSGIKAAAHLAHIDKAIYIIVATVIVCLIVLVPDVISIHHDVAALMNHAGFLIDDPKFGQSIAGLNIPFEQWFYGFPIIMARLLDTSPNRLIFLITMSIAIGCYGLAVQLSKNKRLSPTVSQRRAWVIGLFLIMIVMPISGRNIFSIREHLVVILTLPYIILVLIRLLDGKVSARFGILVGVLAAVGYCAKPFYGLVYLSVEFFFLAMNPRLRSLVRPETIAASTIGISYLIIWGTLYQEYFIGLEGSISNISGFLKPIQELLFNSILYTIPGFCTLIGIWLFRRVHLVQDSTLLLRGLYIVVLSLAVTTVAAIQQRFYPHHVYPILAIMVLAIVITFHGKRMFIPCMVSFAFILSSQIAGVRIGLYFQPNINEAKALLLPVFKGRSVGLIIPHPGPYMQALSNSGGQWRFPFRNIAYLSSEYSRFDRPNTEVDYLKITDMTSNSLAAHQRVLRLFRQQPPQVVLVDRTSYYPHRYIQVDYLRALNMDPEFRELWRQYKLTQQVNKPKLKYDLYSRK